VDTVHTKRIDILTLSESSLHKNRRWILKCGISELFTLTLHVVLFYYLFLCCLVQFVFLRLCFLRLIFKLLFSCDIFYVLNRYHNTADWAITSAFKFFVVCCGMRVYNCVAPSFPLVSLLLFFLFCYSFLWYNGERILQHYLPQ
jgi:hypothetical protein